MSVAWVFQNGEVWPGKNLGAESKTGPSNSGQKKVLVYLPTDNLVRVSREIKYDVGLIVLPCDFSRFKSTHMYDIVVKNRNVFEVHSK
ncbi:flowering-promoting factor 1-like protein 3 [Punica granatum]|uniref:Uncharacterized protein n=2 Tax=Punica granatum TaxID=22663 RepID=A0A218WQ16_PUNGR|nr:flowering-promoting factor 1-like protein 3 [Punica granatum]OWM74092.1 hypothetical protein CDL15_Pgr008403 [Punica granatum]PKI46474.1 hypothetical protein CRG98_033117 [Punica granatum]